MIPSRKELGSGRRFLIGEVPFGPQVLHDGNIGVMEQIFSDEYIHRKMAC